MSQGPATGLPQIREDTPPVRAVEEPTTHRGRAAKRAPHRSFRIGAVLALVTATALLSWVALGGPGTVVLASAWILGAALGRVFPSLRGPASWAAGVLAELGMLLAMSAVVALVSPHLHSRAVHLAVLAIPAMVGVALLIVAERFGRKPAASESRRPGWGVPLAITAGALAVSTWISTRGPFFGVAWAMSGDARNHISLARGILTDGGITTHALQEFPVAMNTLTAILAGAGDRSGGVGQVLHNDVQAMASTYLLAVLATALLLAAALLELLPPAIRRDTVPPAVVATVLVASTFAGSPFALGMALADGFLSAYGALPMALAGIVLALRFHADPRRGLWALVGLAAATLLTFVSWYVLVVVPASLLLVTAIRALIGLVRRASGGDRPSRTSLVLWWTAVVGSLGSLAAIGIVVASVFSRLVASFILTGSSRTTHLGMLVVLLFIALATASVGGSRVTRNQMLLPVVAALAAGGTLAWMVGLPGEGVTWTYYALKTNWLASASLIWVPFAPIVLWASRSGASGPAWERRVARPLAAAASATALLLLVGSATSAQDAVASASKGWNQPSAEVAGKAFELADGGSPYVLWEWSDVGNDRLGNFWAAAAWATSDEGEYLPLTTNIGPTFAYWAYFADDLEDLCSLTGAVPDITVHTHSDTLESDLQTSCAAPTNVETDD